MSKWWGEKCLVYFYSQTLIGLKSRKPAIVILCKNINTYIKTFFLLTEKKEDRHVMLLTHYLTKINQDLVFFLMKMVSFSQKTEYRKRVGRVGVHISFWIFFLYIAILTLCFTLLGLLKMAEETPFKTSFKT